MPRSTEHSLKQLQLLLGIWHRDDPLIPPLREDLRHRHLSTDTILLINDSTLHIHQTLSRWSATPERCAALSTEMTGYHIARVRWGAVCLGSSFHCQGLCGNDPVETVGGARYAAVVEAVAKGLEGLF